MVRDEPKGKWQETVLPEGTEKSHQKFRLVCAPNEMPEEWGTSGLQAGR
jgi:hypothetical protein